MSKYVFQLLLILSPLFLLGCQSRTRDGKKLTPPALPTKITASIVRINIPFREHGYSKFPTTLINSQKTLDSFLTQTFSRTGWNRKVEFLDQIQTTPIDFSKWNLLLYRITESSGSIKLNVGKDISELNGHILIPLKRTLPTMGTDDMAYYALAFKVAKNIKDVTFDDKKQKVVIENKASTQVIPTNCLAWNDGCNDCRKMGTGKGVCTQRACLVYRPQDFRCTQWDN